MINVKVDGQQLAAFAVRRSSQQYTTSPNMAAHKQNPGESGRLYIPRRGSPAQHCRGDRRIPATAISAAHTQPIGRRAFFAFASATFEKDITRTARGALSRCLAGYSA
jgi:hypothetical protein